MDEGQREAAIRRWFGLWLEPQETDLETLFTPDAVYIESWGPEYHGAAAIAHWFREWNCRGRVLRWEIRQFFHKGDQTVVEWQFENRMADGRREAFDGCAFPRTDGLPGCRNSAATAPATTPIRTARSRNFPVRRPGGSDPGDAKKPRFTRGFFPGESGSEKAAGQRKKAGGEPVFFLLQRVTPR